MRVLLPLGVVAWLSTSSAPVVMALSQQIPFQQPSTSSPASLSPSSYVASSAAAPHGDVLYRLSFPTRSATQEAKDRLEGMYDVWRTTPNSIDVVLPSDVSTSDYGATTSSILIPSISSHLKSSPLSGSRMNAILSQAAVMNLTRGGARHGLHDSSIHDSYHPIEGIEAILKAFERDFPAFAKTVVLGASSEGRTIWGLKVTNFNPGQATSAPSPSEANEEGSFKRKKDKNKPTKKHGLVVIGAQHAREWIAPATALYAIHDLLLSTLTEPGSDSDKDETRELLDQIEFTFVPVLNVDGYAFTWDSNRLWRKNRQPVGGDCLGIDLNRNWPFAFAAPTRPNPCSDAYPGSEAFQSPELQSLSAYLTKPENNIVGFLDLHSFGQMILFPYSYSCDHVSPDQENHYEAVVGAQKALRAVHGRSFEVGSVCEVSLTAPGESLDWTYEVAKIRWSFAIELRDQGVYGFLLPPNQIRPSGEELKEAFKELAMFVVRKEAGGRFHFQ